MIVICGYFSNDSSSNKIFPDLLDLYPPKFVHRFVLEIPMLITWPLFSERRPEYMVQYGPLTRYVKLQVAHAPGMPGPFSAPPASKETASYRSWHASRHVPDARAMMRVGIANPRWRGGNIPGIHGACATRNIAYLARGPLLKIYITLSPAPTDSIAGTNDGFCLRI